MQIPAAIFVSFEGDWDKKWWVENADPLTQKQTTLILYFDWNWGKEWFVLNAGPESKDTLLAQYPNPHFSAFLRGIQQYNVHQYRLGHFNGLKTAIPGKASLSSLKSIKQSQRLTETCAWQSSLNRLESLTEVEWFGFGFHLLLLSHSAL